MQAGLAAYLAHTGKIFKLRNIEAWGLALRCVLSAFQPLFPCRTLKKLIYLHRSNIQIKTLMSIKKKKKKKDKRIYFQ